MLTLLADQLESSGKTIGFGKLSTKKHSQKFKNPSNIHKNGNILYIHHFHFFMKVSPLDVVSQYTGTAHSTDGAC